MYPLTSKSDYIYEVLYNLSSGEQYKILQLSGERVQCTFINNRDILQNTRSLPNFRRFFHGNKLEMHRVLCIRVFMHFYMKSGVEKFTEIIQGNGLFRHVVVAVE